MQRIRIRADAGFYSGAFFDLLEARHIEYAIAARVTGRLGRCLTAVSYGPVAADIEAGELGYQAIGGARPGDGGHSQEVVRGTRSSDALFTLERYSYQVIATNVADKASQEVREFRDGRAVLESRIEEVKNQFHLSKILSSDYMASACYFQMVMLAYDLTNRFRRLLLWGELRKAEVPTLPKIRPQPVEL